MLGARTFRVPGLPVETHRPTRNTGDPRPEMVCTVLVFQIEGWVDSVVQLRLLCSVGGELCIRYDMTSQCGEAATRRWIRGAKLCKTWLYAYEVSLWSIVVA